MNKQQITNLLGAGTVTGLMVAAALFFGGGLGSQPDSVAANPNPPAVVIAAEGNGTDSMAAENAQLREAVQLLQGREGEYRAQIEQANILLAENAAQAQGYEGEAYEEDDDYEDYEDDDDYEDEDHAYEMDEDDDEYEDHDEDEHEADEEDHEEDESDVYAEHGIDEYDSEEDDDEDDDDDEDEEGDDD